MVFWCRGVAAFRAWLLEYGGGQVPYEGSASAGAPRSGASHGPLLDSGAPPMPKLSKLQLLNRAAVHSGSCAVCQQVSGVQRACRGVRGLMGCKAQEPAFWQPAQL